MWFAVLCRGGRPLALPLYAFTLFVSAFILFLVQPIIGKIILPKLGGTPQVWNTCMVFFQMVLLAGYAYTHNRRAAPSERTPCRCSRLAACRRAWAAGSCR